MPDIAVVMPKMSMTMTEGEVVAWRRSSGEAVRAGDVVAEVLTDKVEMEVEAPATGVLSRLVAEEGDRVAVGEPLAYITSESEGLLDGLMSGRPNGSANKPEAQSAGGPEPGAGAGGTATPPSRKARVPALPGARRRAGELQVDLRQVTGSGPDGAVTVSDVESAVDNGSDATAPLPSEDPKTPAAPGPRPAAAPASTNGTAARGGADPGFADALQERRTQIRAAVSATMERSVAIPQFTAFQLLTLDTLDRARGGVSWTAVLTSLFARALRADDALGGGSVDVSLAVDTPVGLLAPVIRDADTLPLVDLDAAIREAAERARSGRLRRSDLGGGTTTVSNLGGWGVESFNALLTPDQATALSIGAVRPQPVVRHGGISVVLGCRVGLTVDHRAADGADAARVLARMGQASSKPDRTATAPG